LSKSVWVAMAIFKTYGMHIPGRARQLRLDLGKLEGIRAVDFNYITDTVSIGYDANKLTLEMIRDALEWASV
jgi:copper chaperone CopZ